MQWPQYTMIILMAVGLGVNIAMHGKPRRPHSLGTSLIGYAIELWLLWAGGFFS